MASRKAVASKPAAKRTSGRLAGKFAVVTGGNRGIGLAIARALVAEGCSVMITGRDRAALRAAKTELAAACVAGAAVVAEVCDVRQEKAVAAVFAKVKQRWGRLDILVNNAGISQKLYDAVETPLEVWRAIIDINLTGMFLCTRAAVPLMERGATIVNTLSLTVRTAVPKFAAYNASKMGALGFTDTLRTELVPKGIRVTALIPGATDTAIWEQFWADAPREKMVRAEDVAAGVLYAVTLPAEASVNELLLVPQQGVL
ncbi:MAG TPA: SDR family oxidoreductase [Candidatus Angelobacter sp.]|nr:SDR family oxidoreductase [Candidatus Angelobacter sp.]